MGGNTEKTRFPNKMGLCGSVNLRERGQARPSACTSRKEGRALKIMCLCNRDLWYRKELHLSSLLLCVMGVRQGYIT